MIEQQESLNVCEFPSWSDSHVAVGSSPNRYWAQLKLTSGIVHNCFPALSPAAPAATYIGKIWSSVGCAFLQSSRFMSSSILASRSPGWEITASLSASSKVLEYLQEINTILLDQKRTGIAHGIVLPDPRATRKSWRLCTAIPAPTISIPSSRRSCNAWPMRKWRRTSSLLNSDT